ncbi:MAG: hypothetical protein HQK92_10615 [Nitrospirae bacterium]|nr:hypothetical protein [Nitrospirota bacterium]
MGKIDKKLLKKKEKIFMGDDYKLLVPLAEEFKQYDMAEAVTILKYCLKKHPNYMSAHVSLGKIYMESGYVESAIEEFEQVVGVIPGNILSHRKLAVLYAQTGQTEKAIMTNNRILALNTGDREAIEAIRSLSENTPETELEPLFGNDEMPPVPAEENQFDLTDKIEKTEKNDDIEDLIAASLADNDYADTIATEPDISSEEIIISDDITEEILSDSGAEIEKTDDIEDIIAASLADDDYTETIETEPDTFLDDITAEVLSESGSEGGKTENLFYIDDTIVFNAGDLEQSSHTDDGGFIISPNEPVTLEDDEDTETIITKAGLDSLQLQNDVENVSWDPFAEPPALLSGSVAEYDLKSLMLADDENDEIIELTLEDYASTPDNELITDSTECDTGTKLPSEEISDIDIITDSEMNALVLETSDIDDEGEEVVGAANLDLEVNELMESISITDEIEIISDTIETISDTDEENGIEEVSSEGSSTTNDKFQDEELVVKEEIEMIENYILTERFLSAIKAYTRLQERFPANQVIKKNLDNLRQSARLMDKDENALIRKLDFLKNRLKEKMQEVYIGPAYN